MQKQQPRQLDAGSKRTRCGKRTWNESDNANVESALDGKGMVVVARRLDDPLMADAEGRVRDPLRDGNGPLADPTDEEGRNVKWTRISPLIIDRLGIGKADGVDDPLQLHVPSHHTYRGLPVLDGVLDATIPVLDDINLLQIGLGQGPQFGFGPNEELEMVAMEVTDADPVLVVIIDNAPSLHLTCRAHRRPDDAEGELPRAPFLEVAPRLLPEVHETQSVVDRGLLLAPALVAVP